MKTKAKVIIMMIIALATILLLSGKSQANYQSNSTQNNSAYISGDSGINNVRNMEAEGQVMGLTETHDEDTLLSTSGSNNIDVHLIKNTEYGAIAILSASKEYGKQGEGTARYVYKGEGLKTTTGNVYGIYHIGVSYANNDELTASELVNGNTNYKYKSTINDKYIDRYTSSKERKPGDALLYWHEKASAQPLDDTRTMYVRGYRSIFSYDHAQANTGSPNRYIRACVVSGTGL